MPPSAHPRSFPASPVLDCLADGVMATTADTHEIVYVNDAICQITGYDRADLVGRTPAVLQGPATDRRVIDRLRDDLAAGRTFSGQTVNYRKDGTMFLMEWSIATLHDSEGTPAFHVAVQRDATGPASRLMRAEREARTDPLTGLPNRAHVDEVLEPGSWLSSRTHAAIVVDVDHFKALNDEHGHLVGDEVLRLVARRLTASVRGGDLVARWGGEEFCVLMIDHGDGEDAAALAGRIVAAVGGTPFQTSAGMLAVTASAGSATAGDGLTAAVDVLRAADAAMYAAKHNGRNRAERA